MTSYANLLPDQRLARRAHQLAAALVRLRTISIVQLATSWAEQMAFYRFLANERVTVQRLAAGLFTWLSRWGASAQNETHLLLIQDTTEVSFEAHSGRIRAGPGLGWLSKNRQFGYCMHPTLVVEATRGHALGFADLQVWAKPTGQPNKKECSYRDLPIEEKESFRWIEAVRGAAWRLGVGERPGLRLTTIADREADIYSLFARLPTGCEAIIRACRDRRIEQSPGHLYAFGPSAHLLASPLDPLGDVF